MEDYSPYNKDDTLAKIQPLQDEMDSIQEKETQADAAAKAALDEATAAE